MSDVIKTVHCGCGGEAYYHMLGNAITQGYYICCEECGTKTAVHGTLTEAVKAWNIAMGERTAKVERKSDTYVVTPPKSTTTSYETRTNLWEECGNCHAMGMYHGWNYCPKCGVKLDWSENEF